MLKKVICLALAALLFILPLYVAHADLDTVKQCEEILEEEETLYYQHIGQWFSFLNRISPKGHVITEEEQEQFKHIYANLFQDARDIVEASAMTDLFYWQYFYNAEDINNVSPDDLSAYSKIMELIIDSQKEQKQKITDLETATEDFWEYAFTGDSLDGECYRRSIAIVTELDTQLQDLIHPAKEATEAENER